LGGIVNLIDADAAQDLDDFLLEKPMANLTRPLNLFLTYYEERYDFVFLFSENDFPGIGAAGAFVPINSPARVGTGAVSEILEPGIRTNGRVKGAIGVQYRSLPFAHEIAHYSAVLFDKSFGFGVGKGYSDQGHWGFAGVHGILGGFDPKTLSCQTPPGAAPKDCEPEANGRYRYVVGAFGPSGNVVPYAPLELYLMGLGTLDEVPTEIPLLQDAEEVKGSLDASTRTEVVEAAGMSTIAMSDITARYGVVTPLPANERHFTSAFVIVSATPVSGQVFADISVYAAVFGDRGTRVNITSFVDTNGGRATIDTLLGPRRAVNDPPPPKRAAKSP
jgi:hypothetical protein